MILLKLDREEAEQAGYAVFNGGKHLCVDLDNESTTISVNTPDGNKVTFAFVCRPRGKGHQCVDIVHHGKKVDDAGAPLQSAVFIGKGPTIARTSPEDETPATIVVLLIPES